MRVHVRAVVAFSDADNDGKVIWWSPSLRTAVFETGGSATDLGLLLYCDNRDIMDDKRPTSGLWVWEGTMISDEDQLRFEGEWFLPNVDEWAAIQAGQDPCVVAQGRQLTLAIAG